MPNKLLTLSSLSHELIICVAYSSAALPCPDDSEALIP
jgi:hypothetical protein